MNQHNKGKMQQAMSGQILGYSENGNKLLIAILNVSEHAVVDLTFRQFFSVNEVVAYFAEGRQPLGVGMVETLALSTSRQGWRPADYWIDEAPFHPKGDHDEFPFYFGPFHFHGGKSLQAIALLTAMRRRWPELPATETAPIEYVCHLTREARWPKLQERIPQLAKWMDIQLPPELDEQRWEAAMSAYAMWMGASGQWPVNLHRLKTRAREWTQITAADGVEPYWEPAASFETLIFPAGPVAFFWPPDERFVNSQEDGSLTLGRF